jgi:hypothetical protein
VSRLSREIQDVVTLATTLALVPATWLLLGWRWPRAVSGHDGLANLLVLLQALVEARGDWSRLAYRADLLGGMPVRDAVGPFPPLALFARMGLSPTAILDLTSFLLQAVVAFLGLRAAADLATAWSGTDVRLGSWPRLAGGWACAFAPVLGWKIGAGHQTLLAGMLPFLAAFALVSAAGAGTTSSVLVLVAAAALAGGVLFTGHQMVFYGVVFGGPILFGAWWALGRRTGDLVLPAGVAAGSAILALPDLWGVLAHAFGTDSLRAVHGMRITYSYLTGHPLDWLGSLLWARDVLRPGQPQLLDHEINNPMGPLLLLLALVPWTRARALGVGLAASAALALLFSMNAHPVSDALLLLVPPLGSFRVPTRAMLPALFLLPVLALAGVLLEAGRIRGRTAWALAPAAAIFWVPPLLRELAGWLVAAIVAFRPARLGRLAAVPAVAAFLILAAGGLAAFRERASSFGPYPDGDALLARAHELGAAAQDQQGDLESPLVRVNASFEWPEFLSNTAAAGGLSSLDGYYFPQRRLVELMCATRHQDYQPNSLLLRFPPEAPASRALFQLYDVWWSLDERGAISPIVETTGPAWFARRFRRSGSFAELGAQLVALGDDLASEAARTLWLVAPDPMVARAALPETVDARCEDAQVLEVVAPRGTPGVGARVFAPADCPLTFSMNYAENLRATAHMGRERREPAVVFPAYGALAGVWVPKGATAVRVEGLVRRPPFPALWHGLGAIVLLGLAMYSPRRRRP